MQLSSPNGLLRDSTRTDKLLFFAAYRPKMKAVRDVCSRGEQTSSAYWI
jgi:hypothetical protein